MSVTLRDKTVLITGGALGIGAETARRLHDQGAKLVLVDLDQAALEKTAGELGPDVVHVVGDVRELADMERAVAEGVERFGGIDVVVANAGIASYGSVRAVDPAAFKRVLDINVLGVFHTVRAALPTLVERRGYVLVVSSLAAFAASPGLASYNASKAGAEQFANALRLELKHEGVDVGVAHMSWIDTPLVRDAKDDLPSFRKMMASAPYPINKTTSVEACAKAFVAGIEGRKRTVFVPGWVGAAKRLRNLINSPIGERDTLKHTRKLLPLMDEEVRRLGRSTSSRNVTLED
jgi:NAD(P)-dependent dehydrogenase (short-subunit alcohol dehydrogenase family)